MASYEWIKLSWNKNYAPHFIPCCPHLDNPNLLLLLGVPGYASDDFFSSVLSKFGEVVEVKSQPKPSAIPKFHIPNASKFFCDSSKSSAFRCVYVQFLDGEGLSSFTNAAKMGVSYHITDYTKPLTGCRKWAAEHQLIYPDENELRKECEDYMAGFDQREKLKLQREKEMAETPDEEGWVTVTKSTKFGASVESAQEKKRDYDKKMDKRKKEMIHLYSFQERENRKESLAVLKQKFQEDKEKIAKMKSARKFKPY